MPGRLDFHLTFGKPTGGPARDPGTPLLLVVLADFSGRTARGLEEPLGGRRLVPVDLDSFDSVMRGWEASLPTPGGTTSPPLTFLELEDFHPDRLVHRSPDLAGLLELRRRLSSPQESAAAAEEMAGRRGVQPPQAPGSDAQPAAQPAALAESTEDTLARLLGGRPAATVPPAKAAPTARSQADELIRGIVGTAAGAPAVPGLAGLIGAVELDLAQGLRRLLHDPAFQHLEAAWRGLDFLLRRLPDDERLRVRLLDVSAAELGRDLAEPDPRNTGLHRLLRDRPGAVVLSHFTYGSTAADLATAVGLAEIGAALDLHVYAAAHPQLVGCGSFARTPDPDDWREPLPPAIQAAWDDLRKRAAAEFLGLASPRFLLRQPYGKTGDACESFAFEEFADAPRHEQFLWGNPAILCAYLAARAVADGGEPDEADAGRIDDLPLHRFREDGEPQMLPCAEAWLTDRAMARLCAGGLIPVQSIRGANAVRVGGLPSVRSGGTGRAVAHGFGAVEQ